MKSLPTIFVYWGPLLAAGSKDSHVYHVGQD